jgi:hypothetical protein
VRREMARVNALRWPGCPPRFLEDDGVVGLRFRPLRSDEGDLDEFVELSWRRAWRSRTVASNSAIRSSIDFQAARRAAWASAGMLIPIDSGGRSCWFITRNPIGLYKRFGRGHVGLAMLRPVQSEASSVMSSYTGTRIVGQANGRNSVTVTLPSPWISRHCGDFLPHYRILSIRGP